MLIIIEAVTDQADSEPEKQAMFRLVLTGTYFALALIPGVEGNGWRMKNLEKRGFKLVQEVQAETPDDAALQWTESSIYARLRASLGIVSVYGVILERVSERAYNSKTLSIKRIEEELPFSKQQISRAINDLQQALGHSRLRVILKERLSPMEAQKVFSPQFKTSLGTGLVLLDTFVPAAEAEADRKEWDECQKLAEQIKKERDDET